MHLLRVLLLLITMLVSSDAIALSSIAPRSPTTLSPVVTVQGAGPDQHARLDEALKRFSDQGLELPDLTITFAIGDPDACKGHLGLFQQSSGPPRLTICRNLNFVLVHELAHAWIEATLDEQGRGRYAEARGLETWSGREIEWSDRAAEDAATMMQLNLMLVGQGKDSDSVRDRIAAYEALTDRPSPLASGGSLIPSTSGALEN